MQKLQSAMEYLMTYGWAILAIAIVMVSLYSLGIFNSGSLQPTANPGSCEVVRTSAQTSLAGQCSNLIPKYVGKFNGYSAEIAVKYPLPANAIQVTVTAWVKKVPGTSGDIIRSTYAFGLGFDNGATCLRLFLNSGWGLGSCGYNDDGNWHFVAGTYNGATDTQYVDGSVLGSESYAGNITYLNTAFVISEFPPSLGFKPFNGSMANIQIYNTSLDASSIKALYQEGIGGAPIDVQHLVRWWPLNGNTNDYSGSNDQGTPTNVIWNANWQSGYSSPSS
ncbi:MAG: LamG domain-containing protein [Candidatus Micrarchaeota archaeon]|nr:LamG domain-containing protein [Candidatus Micrarchaeota archaeon]